MSKKQTPINLDNRIRIARNLRAVADMLEDGVADFLTDVGLFVMPGGKDDDGNVKPESISQSLNSATPLNDAIAMVKPEDGAVIFVRVVIGSFSDGRWRSAVDLQKGVKR